MVETRAPLARAAIRVYRAATAASRGWNCRFLPSCSHYAEEALGRHGLLRGGWLTARRLLRCHPLRPAGYDPVPEGRR